MTAILGISAFYHDSAAALLVDGKIVAAIEEERFTRDKHDSSFPSRAIDACLEMAGLTPNQLDHVGFYDKPYLKFDRLIETHLAYAPRSFESFASAMPIWLKQKLRLPAEMRRALGGAYKAAFVFAEHHESHAASAFFPSPFEEAAILTMDGVGEWATASFGSGRGNRITLTHELDFPHSLGLLYSAFTSYCGFAVNADEYKLMGLAPYGEPRFADLILSHLVDLKEDGSFRLDMRYFNFASGLTMINEKFEALFGEAARTPETNIDSHFMDVAASIQKVSEEVVLRAARHLHRTTGLVNLCLSGGVALNCVANGRLLREGPFEQIWVQPASGDSGSALGVALFVWHQLLDNPRDVDRSDSQRGSLLGPTYTDEEVCAALEARGVAYRHFDTEQALLDRVAAALDAGEVIGWFQGPLEFGPRALGSRSILGDPRRPEMQQLINQKVKFREGFRPFAPAVLRESVGDYFEWQKQHESPYMMIVTPVKDERRTPVALSDRVDSSHPDRSVELDIEAPQAPRSEIPAVTHVDYSARIQTLDESRHGRFARLVETFFRLTGCPILINTSFNLSWEPIVCSPSEAIETFMSSDIDTLCIGSYWVEKRAQKSWIEVGEDRRIEAVFDGLLASPCCQVDLIIGSSDWTCGQCGHSYPLADGIPQLFWPHEAIADDSDVTEVVKSFYEENPFPNYQDHESLRSLIDKSHRGGYAQMLNRSIPINSTVLEVGCGTGQLSNFLGIACRRVIGSDLCMNSLRLGEEFRRAQQLDRVGFAQMNLFRPAFKPGSFDVVLCNGVLHHTGNPLGGFAGLVPLVAPGGFIVIGLYNRWGRLMTDLRRQLFRTTGGRARWLDPYLRGAALSTDKESAWFADQYQHPHESKHTVGEVLDWFESAGIRPLRGIPALTLNEELPDSNELFSGSDLGSSFDRTLAQLRQISTGNKEGGFFLMIGQKPAKPSIS